MEREITWLSMAAIITVGFAFIVLLIIALSYTLAFNMKRTVSVFSMVMFFWVSTMIYGTFFYFLVTRLLYHPDTCGIAPYEILLIPIGFVRGITGIYFLFTTWCNPRPPSCAHCDN